MEFELIAQSIIVLASVLLGFGLGRAGLSDSDNR